MSIILVLLVIVAIFCGIIYYKRGKKQTLSFDQYYKKAVEKAIKEMKTTNDSVKTILVLAKVNDSDVVPFFYSRHADGRILKKRLNYEPFPFEKCPANVQESISKGEYIIHKF